jgi:tRNA uridine 5-carbamoylmethylation protein Kti12
MAGNKLRAEINKVEQQQQHNKKRTIQRINKTRSWFFEKINKIDKPLAKLYRGHRDSIQTNKFRSEKGDKTTETEEIQNNFKSYYKRLY